MSDRFPPHVFMLPRHGSKNACAYPGTGDARCGAQKDDPIHNEPGKVVEQWQKRR